MMSRCEIVMRTFMKLGSGRLSKFDVDRKSTVILKRECLSPCKKSASKAQQSSECSTL